MAITSRTVLGVILLLATIFMVNVSHAQNMKHDYKVGDEVEVRFQGKWFSAEVSEVLSPYVIKATFVDDRNKNREWMFGPNLYRDKNASDESSGDPTTTTHPLRTWKSSNGNYSVQAKFVKMDGDKVVLLKQDNSTVSVPLDSLSKADVDHVNELTTVTEDPFVESSEPPAKKETPPKATEKKTNEPKDDVFKEPKNSPFSDGGRFRNPTRRPPNSNTRPNTERNTTPPNNTPSNSTPPPTPDVDNRKIESKPDVFEPPKNEPPKKKARKAAPPPALGPNPNGSGWLIRTGLALASFLIGGGMFAWGFTNRKKYR